jgi:hypothetical protein
MRIIIPDNICDDENFANWLVREIRQELVLACDEKQLEAISKHIEEKLKIEVDIFDIFFRLLNSIVILKGNRVTQIVISNRALCGDARLTTQTMAKLIDVGNIEIRGTHIFSTVFNRVRNNLEKYLMKYVFKNGGI